MPAKKKTVTMPGGIWLSKGMDLPKNSLLQNNRFKEYGYQAKEQAAAGTSKFDLLHTQNLKMATSTLRNIAAKKRNRMTKKRLESGIGKSQRAAPNKAVICEKTSFIESDTTSDSGEDDSADVFGPSTSRSGAASPSEDSDTDQDECFAAEQPRRLVADVCRPSLNDSQSDDSPLPVCTSKRRRVIIDSDSDDSSGQMGPAVSAKLPKTRKLADDDEPSGSNMLSNQSTSKKKPTRKRVIDSDEDTAVKADINGNSRVIDLLSDDEADCDAGGEGKTPKLAAVGHMLAFFNESSESELRLYLRCTVAVAKKIVFLRKFTSKLDLEEKLEETPGLSIDLMNLYKDTLGREKRLDSLMSECDKASQRLTASINGAKQTKWLQEDLVLMNAEFPLKPYQLVGLNWLWTMLGELRLNVILADEMGLGKTIQIIAFLALCKQRGLNAEPFALIVVPASTLDNWLTEMRRFCPGLAVLCYYGSQEDRELLQNKVLSRRLEPDVILTSYTVASSKFDAKFLRKAIDVQFLVLDEAHQVKNCRSNKYTKLMKLPAQQRILLTGTPLQNNLTELISLLHFMMPDFFARHSNDVQDFLDLFASSPSDNSDNPYTDTKVAQAKAILHPFILRRVKADVLADLPAKESRIYLCSMGQRQESIYKSVIERYARTAKENEKQLKGRAGSALLMELRKAANHPLLLRSHYDDEMLWKLTELLMKEPEQSESNPNLVHEDLSVMNDYELDHLCGLYNSTAGFRLDPDYLLDSAKFAKLDEMLPDLKSQGLKVLLFSQFKILLDLLQPYCKRRGYGYLRLDGDTPVVERQDLVNRFNTDPSIFIFLLSTKAGGLGINLTGANHIIIHDIDYNPYNDKQAEDRCHRVGQTRDVVVYRLLTEGTVDERMYELAQKKLELEQQVIPTNADDATSIESLLKAVLFES